MLNLMLSGSGSPHQRVYETIRQRILDHNGRVTLSETNLAAELGVSRTPVREAIRRLAWEGLVRQIPKVGTFMQIPNREDMQDLFEVRLALECLAADRAARFVTAPQLEQLGLHYQRMAELIKQLECVTDETKQNLILSDHGQADRAFHAAILLAAGNRRLMKIAHDTHMLTQAFARRKEHATGLFASMMVTVLEHKNILDAILARDPKAARRAMHLHLRLGRQRALRYIDLENRQRVMQDYKHLGRSPGAYTE